MSDSGDESNSRSPPSDNGSDDAQAVRMISGLLSVLFDDDGQDLAPQGGDGASRRIALARGLARDARASRRATGARGLPSDVQDHQDGDGVHWSRDIDWDGEDDDEDDDFIPLDYGDLDMIEDDDDDEEEEDLYTHFSRTMDERWDYIDNIDRHVAPIVVHPQKAGVQVRFSGDFGKTPHRPHWSSGLYEDLISKAAITPDMARVFPRLRALLDQQHGQEAPDWLTSIQGCDSDKTPRRRRSRRLEQAGSLSSTEVWERKWKMANLASSAFPRPSNVAERLYAAQSLPIGAGQSWRAADMSGYIPNAPGADVAVYLDSPYVSQYSSDGSLLVTCTRDFAVHLYSTQSGFRDQPQAWDVNRKISVSDWMRNRYTGSGAQITSMDLRKTFVASQHCSWTLTDADLSSRNDYLIYSSLTPYVHLVPVAPYIHPEAPPDDAFSPLDPDTPEEEPPDGSAAQLSEAEDEDMDGDDGGRGEVVLNMDAQSGHGLWPSDGALFSVRFSRDGRDIVAGARGGKIHVYDIEAQKKSFSIRGHATDINSVAFADPASSQIMLSGSDDGLVKVWDRRSIQNNKAMGELFGHTRGITHVSPKGDGRYAVSNGKDHKVKLWDLRMLGPDSSSGGKAAGGASSRGGWGRMSHAAIRSTLEAARASGTVDGSVMTYVGHTVAQTLIRCHFSPAATTGQQYIYSGSADGVIYIWALDGRLVQTIDRTKALPMLQGGRGYAVKAHDPSAGQNVEPEAGEAGEADIRSVDSLMFGGRTCVRDVSWHPYEPALMSASISDRKHIAKHEWKGFGKAGLKSLDDYVEKMRAETM